MVLFFKVTNFGACIIEFCHGVVVIKTVVVFAPVRYLIENNLSDNSSFAFSILDYSHAIYQMNISNLEPKQQVHMYYLIRKEAFLQSQNLEYIIVYSF